VLDFKGDAERPATVGAARALTTLITNELATTPGYAPLSNNELRSIVGHAAQQQLLGCEDIACTADIARLAAVDRVVFGSIEQAATTDATTLVFSVTMVDPAAEGGPQVVSRFTTTWLSPADTLVDVARPAIQRLTGGAAAAAWTGSIEVLSLPQAQVTLDGKVVGVTPLAPLRDLAVGVHTIELRKAGYVTAVHSVPVPRDEVVLVQAELVDELSLLPWYQRWYVWGPAAAGIVVVGGAAAAVTAYALLAQQPTTLDIKATLPGAP
jgi:hypothetical protein